MKYEYDSLYFGGEWHPHIRRDSLITVSPVSEEPLGRSPIATEADVDAAVGAARQALRSAEWGGLSVEQRADCLDRFADELEKSSSLRARLTSEQNGMPLPVAEWAEGDGVVGLLRYYTGILRTTPQEDIRERVDGMGRTVVVREPVGVVAAVVPWNFPQVLTMFKVAPALAAGCSVVIKPSPETTLDTFELAAAANRAGLPPGALNIVPGGVSVGRYLIAHPGVDKVAFTGSTSAGREIGEVCGRLVRPATLELGGKSAAVVLDDADLELFAASLTTTSLLNNGQTCYLSTRLLVPAQLHDDVVEAVAAVMSGLTVGDPLEPGTQIGPLVSERQRDRVESYIAAGEAEGAKLVAGGVRTSGRDRGWFVQPTLFADTANDARIAREEIFGPVLVVIPYRDVDTAIALANDSDFGLGGTVWTADLERGARIARRIESGTVGVNSFNLDFGSPFGGVKSSGVGRELGPEGLAAYHKLKTLLLPPGA